MIVFTHTITPRLLYILDFIGKEISGKPFIITTETSEFGQYHGPKINYSQKKIDGAEFRIRNSDLLFEAGIRTQHIECFEINDYKAFFKTEGDFPFDIFAASFYLMSRYEEYLPYQKDMYGRFAYQNSLAFKEKFLHLPLINIWLRDLKKSLQIKFRELTAYNSSFSFIPTYDIDEAYAYKFKQWWRTAGGFAKAIVHGQWSMVSERMKVLLGAKKDPHDVFDWLDRLHEKYDLKPYYFFLVAGETTRYDKNILPSKKTMQHLIRRHSQRYSVGVHPSWQSGDNVKKLKFEISKLDAISGKQIVLSRQHYIRFTLPGTYRQLIDSGVESDFSMGYGSINGFRASVATTFFWYDLKEEEQTKLLIYPFCFMEANSYYEQKFLPQQALDELREYYNVVKSINGTFITIWHNNFLGTAKRFKGWREVYEKFVSQVQKI